MKHSWLLLPAFLLVVCLTVPVFAAQGYHIAIYADALSGTIVSKDANGNPVYPSSSTIYILFAGRADREGAQQHVEGSSAGDQFMEQFNKLLRANPTLKKFAKKRTASPEDRNAAAGAYLESMDKALLQAEAWIAKHAENRWHEKTVSTDAGGNWVAPSLIEGRYVIVSRADFPAWEEGCVAQYAVASSAAEASEGPPIIRKYK